MGNPVEAIVTAVAEEEGTAPLEIEPPLATVIEADALERLLRSGRTGPVQELTVQLTYRGHDVLVTGDGDVDIR